MTARAPQEVYGEPVADRPNMAGALRLTGQPGNWKHPVSSFVRVSGQLESRASERSWISQQSSLDQNAPQKLAFTLSQVQQR
jgi:hypothetical protein